MLYYIYNIIYDLTSNLIYNKPSVTEIIPGLWLGNHQSAIDIDFLKKNDINFILNCTPNTPFFNELRSKKSFSELQDIDTYRIPVNDSLLEIDFILMEKYLKIFLPILVKKYTSDKKNILIHCQAGKQRSAIVVAALLKRLLDKNYITIDSIPTNISKEQQYQLIYDYLLSKRSQVFTYGLRINFDRTYKRFFNF
jgi:protein tyrosine/serine phosphatase